MSDHSHELVDDARLQHLHPYSPSVQMLQSFGVKTARAIATTAASAATLSLTSDYCKHCADMLVNAITRSIPVPERYEDKFRNKETCVACEVDLINSQCELRGEDR